MFGKSMNEEPNIKNATFSIVAYLAAVAVGCLGIGVLVPFGYGAVAPVALLVGFLPGLLMCLPITLLSFHVAKRFRLVGAVWYGAFGTLTGLSVAVIFSFALGTEVTSVAYVTFIFAASGAAAGLMYRWVERQESDYRNRRHQTKQ